MSNREVTKARGTISFENQLEREAAATYLESIAHAIKSGRLSFEQGDVRLSVLVPQAIDVKVKAKRKGAKVKVSYDIAWREPTDSGSGE